MLGSVFGIPALGFERSPTGVIDLLYVADPSTTGTYPWGLNDSGMVIGNHAEYGSFGHGFLRGPAGKIDTFDYPGAIGTTPTAINANGVIVGYYDSEQYIASSAFVRNQRGAMASFQAPGATITQPTSINSAETVVGYASDLRNPDFCFIKIPAIRQ